MRPLTSRPRLSNRVAGLAAAGVVAALALTGCIKVDADVAINSEALGSGTLSFELQKEAADFLGVSDLATFESQLTEGDLSDSGLGGLGNCATSESDTGYVYTCTFTDEAFTEPDGIWTIAKEGEQIVFRMVNEGQAGADGSDAAALLGDASMGSINVNVTFPGPITEVTGDAVEKTSDTSATVSGDMTSNINVTITSEAGSGGFSLSSLLVVLVGLGVVVLIVIVIIVLIMRRRKPADAAVDAATAPAAVGVVDGAIPDDAPSAAPATVVAVEDIVTEDAAPDTIVTDAVTEEAVTEEAVTEDAAPDTIVTEVVAVEYTVPEDAAPDTIVTEAVTEEAVAEEVPPTETPDDAPGEPGQPTS